MEVVWAFEQGTALPPGHKGVCMQLVAYWLSIMQYAKAENDTAPAKLAASCKAEALKLQKAYGRASKDQPVGADEAVTWQLRKLRLREGVYRQCGTAAEIVRFMDEKRQGYSMGIYFSGGGGHALGFWRSGESTGLLSRFNGHTYFFDPNVGCFKGDTSEFRSSLGAILNAVYPTCNRMEIAKVDKALEARKHWQGAGAFRYG